jgi:hypothetical protein
MTFVSAGEILLLALGHDQNASRCPWVQLTRSTTDYPSRRAQAALSLLTGSLDPTPDVAAVMFHCDGRCRCQLGDSANTMSSYSNLVFDARTLLVDSGCVQEAAQWKSNFEQFGNVYGDIGGPYAKIGSSHSFGSVLYVPGAASLFLAPEIVESHWKVLRQIHESISVTSEILDSGFVLREVGLKQDFDSEVERIRNVIGRSGYQTIIGGTPKGASELSVVLSDMPVSVLSLPAFITTNLESKLQYRTQPEATQTVALHASEQLLLNSPALKRIDLLLTYALGDSYLRSDDISSSPWPASTELPPVAMNEGLAAKFASNRAEQLLSLATSSNLTVLTVDPHSRLALETAAGGRFQVADLLTFVDALDQRDD